MDNNNNNNNNESAVKTKAVVYGERTITDTETAREQIEVILRSMGKSRYEENCLEPKDEEALRDLCTMFPKAVFFLRFYREHHASSSL
jgi:hypothetical protein